MTLLLIAVLSAFIVITAFVFVATAKRALDAGIWCPWYGKLIAYLWLIVGLPSDVLFNWIFGTVIFREFPRELLFTSRVKRHYYHGEGWRDAKAAQWAEFLNHVDPGHV